MPANPVAIYPQSGGGGLQLIQKYVSPGGVATITLASIPQNFTHLQLVISGTNSSGNPQTVLAQFSGDAGANYSYVYTLNNNGSLTGAGQSDQTAMLLGDLHNFGGSAIRATILNYSSANVKSAEFNNAYLNPTFSINNLTGGGLWSNAAAVTSIVLSLTAGDFNSDVEVSLYGLQ